MIFKAFKLKQLLLTAFVLPVLSLAFGPEEKFSVGDSVVATKAFKKHGKTIKVDEKLSIKKVTATSVLLRRLGSDETVTVDLDYFKSMTLRRYVPLTPEKALEHRSEEN